MADSRGVQNTVEWICSITDDDVKMQEDDSDRMIIYSLAKPISVLEAGSEKENNE